MATVSGIHELDIEVDLENPMRGIQNIVADIRPSWKWEDVVPTVFK